MICLRCGFCCMHYLVTIVDDPEKGVREDNLIVHKGGGVHCKHLKGEGPGKFSCKIHDRPWYKTTPCYSHGQIERSPDTPCRMGEFVLRGKPGP